MRLSIEDWRCEDEIWSGVAWNGSDGGSWGALFDRRTGGMCLRLFTFIHVNLLYCIVLYCSARTDTHPHGDFVGYLARRTAGTAMSNC